VIPAPQQIPKTYTTRERCFIVKEGARVTNEKQVLQNPSLNFMDLKGNFTSTPPPGKLKMRQTEEKVRETTEL
jgi:hypothetical protein